GRSLDGERPPSRDAERQDREDAGDEKEGEERPAAGRRRGCRRASLRMSLRHTRWREWIPLRAAEEMLPFARPDVRLDSASHEAAQGLDLVGALPGELGLGPAEVAVGGGLLVDRAAQVQVLDDALGGEGEDL